MLNCPRCTSADKVKSGTNKGCQRYKCKTCQYFFTVARKSDTATTDQRRLAVTLYLEGLGFRSIGRVLGFSHVAVYQWIKALGEEVAQIKRPAAQIVELDELHSYVGHKKTIAGSGLLLIDLGNASSMLSLAPEALVVTGARLWAAVMTVEGYNSLLRHFLARFRRKTKCYSKSETMLRYSVMLLMAQWNGELGYISN